MKEFLKSFNIGVSKNSLSAKEQEITRNLLNVGAISEYKGKYYQNDGFVFGKLDISSNGTGYLSAFDDKFESDLIIENKHINGAHFGDTVLAKIISKKKGQNSCKSAYVCVSCICDKRYLY